MTTPKELQISAALQTLADDSNLSIRAAARLYNVSERTLRRRRNYGLSRQASHTHQQLLSPAQEEVFVDWIVTLEANGHAPTHNTLREMAGQISIENGGTGTIGKKWLQSFFQRHSEVHTKKAVRIDNDRATGANKDDLTTFFELFQRCRATNKVATENVWNMDETGTQLGASTHYKVAGTSSTSKTYKKAPKSRQWVTTIETVSATGKYARCLIIFKGATLQTSWFSDTEIPDWKYCCSENAFTTNKLGCQWLDEVFLPDTAPKIPNAPRILLLDNHGSHITVEFMWKCYQNKVHLIYMPPHTSHVVQPLDLSIFSRIKASYKAQIEELARFEDSIPIKKIRFVKYYNQARLDALTEHVITAGWRAAGLYPWNPLKVLNSKQILSNQQLSPKVSSKRRQISISETLKTPHNKRQLLDLRDTFISSDGTERVRRTLFTKIMRGYENLHFAEAQNKQQLAVQSNRISELVLQKQKKPVINNNERFANIEDVKKAHDLAVQEAEEKARKAKEAKARKDAAAAKKAANPAAADEAALKKASEQALQLQIEQMCSVFDVNDVVEEEE